jgi:hypothetical protein
MEGWAWDQEKRLEYVVWPLSLLQMRNHGHQTTNQTGLKRLRSDSLLVKDNSALQNPRNKLEGY